MAVPTTAGILFSSSHLPFPGPPSLRLHHKLTASTSQAYLMPSHIYLFHLYDFIHPSSSVLHLDHHCISLAISTILPPRTNTLLFLPFPSRHDLSSLLYIFPPSSFIPLSAVAVHFLVCLFFPFPHCNLSFTLVLTLPGHSPLLLMILFLLFNTSLTHLMYTYFHIKHQSHLPFHPSSHPL